MEPSPSRLDRNGRVGEISSLEASAKRQLEAVRAHWSIENSLHWSMGVTFREDHCRVRKDHGPQNMATLRQISITC